MLVRLIEIHNISFFMGRHVLKSVKESFIGMVHLMLVRLYSRKRCHIL